MDPETRNLIAVGAVLVAALLGLFFLAQDLRRMGKNLKRYRWPR